MQVARPIPLLPTLLLAALTLAACSGPSKQEQELEVANSVRADSIAGLRSELFDQMMEGTRFVNQINAELAKARSMAIAPRELRQTAEMADVNEERRQIVSRITQLVARLDNVSFRLSTTRNQLAERDSTLARKIAEHELLVAEASQAAERQRAELQAVIDAQTVKIASLTQQVDTLTGALGQLTSDHNAAYVVVGTRAELIEKGVLVREGTRRFGLVGPRQLVPARELDPAAFTRIDRTADKMIVLPDGEYKIVSRQNTAHAAPPIGKGGKYAGAVTIEQPERFWSTSRFLIIVRS